MISQILLEQEIKALEDDQNHLCLIYNKDPLEQMPAIFPFIKQGLEKNEQVIYVAEEISIDQLKVLFRINWIDADFEVSRGALKLWTEDRWVSRDAQDADMEKNSRKFKKLVNQAQQDGFSGIRFIVEMTWVLGADISLDKVEKWEASLNAVFTKEFPGKIICQYNRSKLPESLIKQAFRTHPYSIVDNCLCKNIFFPNGGNSNNNASDHDADWLIKKLKHHKSREKSPEFINNENLLNFRPGTHVCNFYENKDDLKEVLVAYFKAGLENNELCMWATSEPLEAAEAEEALRDVVPSLDSYIENGQIEIVDYKLWYYRDGTVRPFSEIITNVLAKEQEAIANGFSGLRASGNLYWLEQKHWNMFRDFEHDLNTVIAKSKITALCSYPLEKCSVSEVIDIVSTHQRTVIKREGNLSVIENNNYLETNRELENKIQHRTRELSNLLKEKEVLLTEIHHRVKNNLGIISGLLQMQANNVPDENCRNLLGESEGRVHAMAMIHELLYQHEDFSSIDFGVYIRQLLHHVSSNYKTAGLKITSNVKTDTVFLEVGKAVPAALICHELLTNAYKHAFQGRPSGRISVTLSHCDGTVTLVVCDDGTGFDPKVERTTLGLSLISGLAKQINGAVSSETKHGTVFTVTFPASD